MTIIDRTSRVMARVLVVGFIGLTIFAVLIFVDQAKYLSGMVDKTVTQPAKAAAHGLGKAAAAPIVAPAKAVEAIVTIPVKAGKQAGLEITGHGNDKAWFDEFNKKCAEQGGCKSITDAIPDEYKTEEAPK